MNGKVVEEKIYSQFASISGDDVEKMIEMYSVFDTCTNLTSISFSLLYNLKYDFSQ
jgi:hypothetical protein